MQYVFSVCGLFCLASCFPCSPTADPESGHHPTLGQSSIPFQCHILFMYSSVQGHLNCFHFFGYYDYAAILYNLFF